MIDELQPENLDYLNYDVLFKHLTGLTGLPLSEQEQDLIEQSVKVKRLKRRQFFLREGDLCRHMLYIVSGSMRMYAIDQNGREHTIILAIEGSWISDYESFYGLHSSRYAIVASEDAVILQISKEQLLHLKSKSAVIRKMVYLNDYKNIINTQNRVYAAINLSAEERFQQMMDAYPTFIHRFSQNVVASYLGIAFETLSRIRKQGTCK